MTRPSPTFQHNLDERETLVGAEPGDSMEEATLISHEEITLAVAVERLAQKLSRFSSLSFYLPLLVGLAGAGVSLHGLEFCVPFAIGALVAIRLMSVATPELKVTELHFTEAEASPINNSDYDSTLNTQGTRTADEDITGNSAIALNASDC